jgi:two-component system, OmpR family, alkaline phosphatase synthesis response regulator PhoP
MEEPMAKKVLVIDDDPSISTLLQYNLQQAGFEVIAVFDGEAGLNMVFEVKPDFILLDLMLPKMDGFEVCRKLRAQQIMTPILMLTAKDDEIEKVLGLELGADDYMIKPFSPREVVARVKVILRRVHLTQIETTEMNIEPSIEIEDLCIFPDQYEAYLCGKRLELTHKEFELLVYLAKHKGRVLTRDQLLNAVWNYDFASDTRIVDVHISHLRDKLEKDPKTPQYIKTIRGVGYKLERPTG